MSELRLTVCDRILLHLARFVKQQPNDFVAPYCLTQDGIGESIKVSRAHASIELRKMISKGQVLEEFKHVDVDGVVGIKRKVYSLTQAGMAEVAGLKNLFNGAGMSIEELIVRSPSMTAPRDKLRQEIQIWLEKGKQLQRQVDALED